MQALAGALLVIAVVISGCFGPDGVPDRSPGESREGIAFEKDLRTSAHCKVRSALSSSYRLTDEALVLKAPVEIKEDVEGLDRWSARFHVEWTQWPTKDPLFAEPQGDSPGKEKTHKQWASTAGRTDRIHDELRLSWDESDFEVDGKYKAAVTTVLTKETLTPAGEWKTICNQSGDSTITVRWQSRSAL